MVHAGRERHVRDWLEDESALQGINETILPEVTGSNDQTSSASHSLLLFSSYVFIRCQLTDDIYAKVTEHRYVFQILGHSYRIPTPLQDDEITHLKAILGSDSSPRVTPRVGKGDEVEVVEGAMKGVRGRILELRSRDVRIEVDFTFLDLGATVSIVVPTSQIKVTSG